MHRPRRPHEEELGRPVDEPDSSIDRRTLARAVTSLGAVSAAGSLSSLLSSTPGHAIQQSGSSRIKQSVCRWCFADTEISELARRAKQIGLVSVELLGPDEVEAVTQEGLACAVVNSHPLWIGLAHADQHENCLAAIRRGLATAEQYGCPNVITFSGNRKGISDEDALRNAAEALAQVVPEAERRGVTIVMELLNSKVDHPDYLCDNTRWGVDLVERVGSQHFKLLYDIYHMQIMEGDVIRTIRDHHDKIGHYHTAGVPGRHELDENQELFYPAIVRAILETGYQGYLGQEFIPTAEDPFVSLAAGFEVCAV